MSSTFVVIALGPPPLLSPPGRGGTPHPSRKQRRHTAAVTCPWCGQPQAAASAKKAAEDAAAGMNVATSTKVMFAVVAGGEVRFARPNDLDDLFVRLAAAGSDAKEIALQIVKSECPETRGGGRAMATALAKRWSDSQHGAATGGPECMVYGDGAGALYVGPPQVIFTRLGVVVLPRAVAADSRGLLEQAKSAAAAGRFVELVGHLDSTKSRNRNWYHTGDPSCPRCGGAPTGARKSGGWLKLQPSLKGQAGVKARAVTAARAANLAGREMFGNGASVIESLPGATAQQTHVDQLPQKGLDKQPIPDDDSAAIVVVALSEGGCKLDAVIVDWRSNGPGGAPNPNPASEAEPHSVCAANQGDILMIRYDLRHRGAAHPADALANYRLHFHLDTLSTYRGRKPGVNHYEQSEA